jgi:hypothetical protein
VRYALVVALIVGVAGCGSDREAARPSSARPAAPPATGEAVPRAAESIDAANRRLSRSLRTAKNCGPIERAFHPLTSRSLFSTRFCKKARADLKLYSLFQTIPIAYGSGGVIRIGGDITLGVVLDRTRHYRLAWIQAGTPLTGGPSARSDQVARTVVDAIRKSDCVRLRRVAGLLDAHWSAAEFCLRPELRLVTKALARDPAATPRRLGGDEAFAFYGLSVKPHRYFTIVLLAQRPGDYKFVDAYPAR